MLLTKGLIVFQVEDSGLEFLWWIARLSENVLTFLNFPLWKSTLLLQLKVNAFEIQKLYYIEAINVWMKIKSWFRTCYILHMHVKVTVAVFKGSGTTIHCSSS